MPTVNESLQTAAIDHSHDLIRYQNNVTHKVMALLNRSDKDIAEKLTEALSRLPPDSFTVERLDMMLKSVRGINEAAYKKLQLELSDELGKLVSYEMNYQGQLLQSQIPVTFQVASVPVQQVISATVARPFQGKILSEWMSALEADKAIKIRDAVRMGYVEGEPIDKIVRRIMGTKANRYQDGIMEINRRHAESVVRTAISHTAHHTRQKFGEANSDIVKGVKWVSTLDSKTSEICQARDGQVLPLNSGPRPPAHYNCRSTVSFIMKSWKELGIDAEDLPEGTRASMDGQVPAKMTYNEWLKTKPAEFQNEVLGPSRAKLFRAGMPVDRFVNRAGDKLTLDDLRKRDAEYFRKAGL